MMLRFSKSTLAVKSTLALGLILAGGAYAADAGTPERDASRWPANVYQLPHKTSQQAEIESRVASIISAMTLEQKVAQIIQPEIRDFTVEDMRRYGFGSYLNGGGSFPGNNGKASAADWVALADKMYQAAMDTSVDGIAIAPMWGTDAVHGHGNVFGATLFPHNIGLGATHSPELIKAIAAATAKEVRATGIDWVFAPTVALVDNLRWGRSYEGYARDPKLIERYAEAFIDGMQGEGANWLGNDHTIATAKHFIGDGGTVDGDDRGDTRVDEATLIARHGQGYVGALGHGVQTVMASFNSWNGEKLHGSKYLLTEVLKGRMGFDGVVVGDWLGHGFVPGCSYERCPEAVNAGVDILMAPGDSWKALYSNTIDDVKSGVLPASRLDDAVKRILRVKLRAGLFDNKPPSANPYAGNAEWIGHPEHRAIARQAVAESLVLLKNQAARGNTQPVLPIAGNTKVLVVGEGADSIPMQSGGWSMTWQGTEVTNADFPGATSIFAGIKAAMNQAGGDALLSSDGSIPVGFNPDVVIAVYGEQPYAEGNGDLDDLEYQRGDKRSLAMLKSIKDKGLPLVSVALSGRPLWMNPEINASDAFVAAWLPGTEGAGVADVLIADNKGLARADFKGRLPFPWPATPAADGFHSGADKGPSPLFDVWQGFDYKSNAALAPLGEDNGSSQADSKLAIFDKAIKAPWHLAVGDDRALNRVGPGVWQQGAFAVRSVNRTVQEDARRFDFAAAGILSFRDDFSADLRRFAPDTSVLAFDVAVTALPGQLQLSMLCEGGCRQAVELSGKVKTDGAWQRIEVPLSCFGVSADELARTFSPMTLSLTKGGSLMLANISLEAAIADDASGADKAQNRECELPRVNKQ
ncbi:glycoside hydrolase family 3 C-terminal domain-containing protein [Shewanella sp. JM162201]|uniref:Glycoside hydrolase family 3 C-terminal domain-containing protein n=1 Tax=Shewanella jiangmenensis TaxID=2837387 RepID=A0ABS5V3H0_9GAMM|nr:glycoside hydrolase family 3 N-terminal domain-containing protein [Shewanella jiangmenensis]MBT1444997.1 glycoside hydrolase family 3 C-terminal domain-containing protein [Shewanella jiangmenensis]